MATARTSIKDPPVLNDEKSFNDWKKELEFWQIATDVKPEKQGATVFLSLKGKSREAVLEMSAAEIKTANGLDAIVAKLDTLWKEDENLEAFNAYERFEKFKRPSDMSVNDYIIAFERLNNKLAATDTTLPEGVLAYRLLKSAGLTMEQEQLAKATVGEFTYKAMCTKLKSIFGDSQKKQEGRSSTTDAIQHLPEMKNEAMYMEEAYYNNQRNYGPSKDVRGAGEWKGNAGRGRQDDRRGYNNWQPGNRQPWRQGASPTWRQQGSSGSYNRGYQAQAQDTRPKQNPLDVHGQQTRCLTCGSTTHWRANCPKQQSTSRPFFTMYADSSIQECYMSKLVGETFASGILDSGCTKTVCGTAWYREFLENLNQADKARVKETSSSVPYKFGGSEVINSNLRVVIPIYVGSQQGNLETEVVDSDLPLLISKDTMKKSGMVLNFDRDTATFNGEDVNLGTTSSGHYFLTLTKPRNQMNLVEQEKALPEQEKAVIAFMTFNVEGKTQQEKDRTVKKLHTQFGHPSHEKLIKLVKVAGCEDVSFMKMIKEYTEKCEICLKYSRKNPRPVVGMSLSSDFNGTIAMDLKQVDKHIVLHIIDLATRYSNAVVVDNKRKETIVEAILLNWVNTFGVPDRILSDNGGEFNNMDMLDMGNNLNTEVTTTAAESPWSNGVCERHNAVIGNMVKKIVSEARCDIKTALAWAVNAKNCLHNVYGFSPAQLVFGRNPNLPSVLNDKLPALEGATASEQVAQNLRAKHEARKSFIEAESSEKIRRALRHNSRESTSKVFEAGEKVYYKRIDSESWRGPAVVMGRDSHQVVLKHGGIFIRTHPTSLKKVHDPPKQPGEEKKPEDQTKIQMDITYEEDESADEREEANDEEPRRDSTSMHPIHESSLIEVEDDMHDDSITSGHNLSSTTLEELLSEEINATDSTLPIPAAPSPEELARQHSLEEYPAQSNTPPINFQILPSKNTRIHFRDRVREEQSDEWLEGNVINRAGKSGGRHQMWMNVELIPSRKIVSVNFDQVEWKAKLETTFLAENRNDPRIIEAIAVEMQNLQEHDTYEAVDDIGQDYLNTKFEFKEKQTEEGSQVKARLVAKGFQENTEALRKDSPTCTKSNLRTLLTLSVSNNWKVKSIDIKSAFLQGRDIQRELFVKPPAGVSDGKLWKLKKCLYGLNDAAREWYLKVKETVEELQGQRSQLDHAVFFWKNSNGDLRGYCATHVDDFSVSGTPEFLDMFISGIKKRFTVSSETDGFFKYVGLEIMQLDDYISLTQVSYINDLEQTQMDGSPDSSCQSPLNEEQKKHLKSIVGQLMWISNNSRPDVSYDVCDLSNSVAEATQKEVFTSNKIIRRLKSDQVSIRLDNVGSLQQAEIIAYTDASYRNLKNNGSQGGQLIMLKGRNGKYSVLNWKSKKIKRTVKSTEAAEALALQEGAELAFVTQSFMNELTGVLVPITLRTDNKSLWQNIHSTKQLSDERLQIDISIMREMVEKNEVAKVEWVSTEKQLADCLTKKGASSRKLVQALGGGWAL